jgi:TP901 family phage tail tape measure protein/lambda family phage tail tape measure protein
MSDIAKLEIDETPMVNSVGRATKALTELEAVMRQLHIKGSASIEGLVAAIGESAKSGPIVRTVAEEFKRAAATMVVNAQESTTETGKIVKQSTQLQLNLVRALNQSLQQDFEKFAVQYLSEHKEMNSGMFLDWQKSGARLSGEMKRELKERLAAQSANLADQAANLKAASVMELQELRRKEVARLAYEAEFAALVKAEDAEALADKLANIKAADAMELQELRRQQAAKAQLQEAADADTLANIRAADAMELAAFQRAEKAKTAALELALAQRAALSLAALNRASGFATSQVGAAMSTAGTYQEYRPDTGSRGSVIPAKDIDLASKSMQVMHLTARDANSALRGMAQGFGFISSGLSTMLPLMAGFTLAAATVKSLKFGAQFEQSLFVIEELAGTASESMGGLSEKLLHLGATTQYGPLEAAKGLEILTLAGLSAADAISALRPALDFAAAGGVTMEAASETLVAVATAYGYSAKAFSTVGDVIAKTAAESMASVSGMSESFRTASVLAQSYNVTLADTATGLRDLSQIGIVGGRAGTSLRNFYTEITKSSGVVNKTLKDMRVELYNIPADGGGLKSLLDIVQQIDVTLVNKTQKAFDSFFAVLTNERGGKVPAAIFSAAREEMAKLHPEMNEVIAGYQASGKEAELAAYKTETLREAYEALKHKQSELIDSAAGFTFFAALEAQITSLGSYKGVVASLEASYIKAFGAASDGLYLVGARLRETFNSPEFTESLASVVKGFANLLEVGVKVGGFLVEQPAAFAALAAGGIALAYSVSGVATSMVAAAVGTTTFGTAVAAARTELGLMNIVAAAGPLKLLVLAAAVGTLAVAWFSAAKGSKEYNDQQAKAASSDTLEMLNRKNKDTKTSIEEMIVTLEAEAEARRTGATAAEAAAKVVGEKAIQRVGQEYDLQRAIADTNYQKERGILLDTSGGDYNSIKHEAEALEAKHRFAQESLADRKSAAQLEMQINVRRLAQLAAEKSAADVAAAAAKHNRPGALDDKGASSGRPVRATEAEQAAKRAETEFHKLMERIAARKALAEEAAASTNKLSEGDKAAIQNSSALTEVTEKLTAASRKQLSVQIATAREDIASAKASEQATAQRLLAAKSLSESHKIIAEAKASAAAYWNTDSAKTATGQASVGLQRSTFLMTEPQKSGALEEAQALGEYSLKAAELSKALEKAREVKEQYVETFLEDSGSAASQLELDIRLGTVDALEHELEVFTQIATVRAKERGLAASDNELQKAKDRKDHLKGAYTALKSYDLTVQDVAKSTESMVTRAFKGMEDALTNFAMTGRLSFSDLANSIVNDMVRIAVQQNITGPLAGMGMSFISSMLNPNAGVAASQGLTLADVGSAFARGAAFSDSGVQRYASGGTFTNSVVSRPTMFRHAGGAGMMGEAGAEAVMPLRRGPDGSLGVAAAGMGGGGGNSVVVNVIEAPGQGGTQSRRSEGGVDYLDILVEKVKSSVASDINRGSGSVPAALGRTYNLNRTAGAY